MKRGQHHAYAVMDSLRLELWSCRWNALCQTVSRHRRHRLLYFEKEWYYWFKLHLQVTDQGLAMGCVVTEASCHERMAAESVMAQIPHP